MSSTYIASQEQQNTIQYSAAVQLTQIIGGSLFLALCAQIKIPLFFTPVPLAMHTFAVMLLGGFLGKKTGTLAVLAFLLEIACGLPFSATGLTGPLAFAGPTGGYLVGFIMQAYCCGWIVENRRAYSSFQMFVSFCLIGAVQLLIGTLWLSTMLGFDKAFAAGYYPFIIGDSLKCLAVTQVLARWK